MTGKRVCPKHEVAHDIDKSCPYCDDAPKMKKYSWVDFKPENGDKIKTFGTVPGGEAIKHATKKLNQIPPFPTKTDRQCRTCIHYNMLRTTPTKTEPDLSEGRCQKSNYFVYSDEHCPDWTLAQSKQAATPNPGDQDLSASGKCDLNDLITSGGGGDPVITRDEMDKFLKEMNDILVEKYGIKK